MINLKKMFRLQADLDSIIYDRAPIILFDDLLNKKILALQVELGECCNEWRGFKYWSKKTSPSVVGKKVTCGSCGGAGLVGSEDMRLPLEPCDTCRGKGTMIMNPLLEEYVDALHFVLSIGLLMGHEREVPVTSRRKLGVDERYIELMANAAKLRQGDRLCYQMYLGDFLALGKQLKFRDSEIERMYVQKNHINRGRQVSGY